MKMKSNQPKASAEQVVKDIRRATLSMRVIQLHQLCQAFDQLTDSPSFLFSHL